MHSTPNLSRRGLLALGAAAGAGLALGAQATPALAHDTVTHSEIWNQPTYVEDLNTGSHTRTSFAYNAAFYTQLENWLMDWYGYTPTNWIEPIEIWSNGVHVDKPGMHQYGRAIDISRMRPKNYNDGNVFNGFIGRYDVWRSYTGSTLTTARKRYWGTVASLNKYFGVVLTYAYNSEHYNHVHADNSEANTFNRSTSQVLMVQAVCNYIWGYSTTIDGVWGSQSDTNSRNALARFGRTGGLTTSTANWHAFCMVSLGQATGRFTY
ncbi:hypothetical protein Rhe02_19470 [Rhizocola hellebori]|uniref:Uncharacterized protein n=1 Tax=Rhizocola hellebori TaxID=1392758 RepID=A0A8J3VEU4_9ACTN|nr:hypothetical protein [Rhizocola hellebori]GIH03880.1 hypothetical protein Rhe02_19470 [Rhizocola hellebori]